MDKGWMRSEQERVDFREWLMLGEGTLWFGGFNEMQDLKRVDWL